MFSKGPLLGYFGQAESFHLLENVFENEQLNFNYIDDADALLAWADATFPFLVVLEGTFLSKLKDADQHELFRRLESHNCLILILTESLEEIQNWKSKSGLPHCHYYPLPINPRSFHRKVSSLLLERFLLEAPLVLIVGESDAYLSQMDLRLKNAGMRTRSHKNFGSTTLFEQYWASERPDAAVWQNAALQLAHPLPEGVISFVIEDSELAGPAIEKISNQLSELKLEKIKVWRDTRTGLYLPSLFTEMAERELDLCMRTGSPFSVVKLFIRNRNELARARGEAYMLELESNLGVFVQNRIRLSDIIARSETSDVLVLLSRVAAEQAVLIGERLVQAFSQVFEGQGSGVVVPTLAYELISCPQDQLTPGALKTWIRCKGESSASRSQNPSLVS